MKRRIASIVIGLAAMVAFVSGCTESKQPSNIKSFDVHTNHGRMTCVENTDTGSLSCS